jgi:hypothetical protein
MKMLFTFLLSFISIAAFTQDSWKLCLDKKLLLKSSVEDEEKNSVKLSPSALQKSKSFSVDYKAASPQAGWQRSILIFDEKDKELKKQSGNTLTLKASDLKKLFQESKKLKIYTISLPTDPKLRAQVRVRRVHLCTLILQ